MLSPTSTLARRAGWWASRSAPSRSAASLRPGHLNALSPVSPHKCWGTTTCARRSLCATSCRLAHGTRATRPTAALADALLSQWSRSNALANADGGRPAAASEREETTGPSKSDLPPTPPSHTAAVAAAAAAPPSIEELFADTEEFMEARSTRDGELPGSSAASVGTSSSNSPAPGNRTTQAPQPAPAHPAPEATEAALLDDLLRQQLTTELLEVDEDDVNDDDDKGDGGDQKEVQDEPWAEADPVTRTDEVDIVTPGESIKTASASLIHADVFASTSPAATEAPRSSPSSSAPGVSAPAAGQPDPMAVGDAGVDEEAEESMEDVLEEEAERLYRAALANMTRKVQHAGSSGVDGGAAGSAGSGASASRSGGVSEYTFFPEEAVKAAVESLAALEHAEEARVAAPTGTSAEAPRASPKAAAEFDDAAAREAELESLGDDMATAERAGAAASKR